MTRRIIIPGAGSSGPLRSSGGANRKAPCRRERERHRQGDRASVLGALLRRHELTPEGRNLAQRGSALVHFVRDENGRRLVIKEPGRRYGGNEEAWLSAHASHPGVVDVLDEIGGLLLLRWVPGPLLAELSLGAAHHARAAGGTIPRPPHAPP